MSNVNRDSGAARRLYLAQVQNGLKTTYIKSLMQLICFLVTTAGRTPLEACGFLFMVTTLTQTRLDP